MRDSPVERKLTAILSADVAGFSRLMELDEETTLLRLEDYRRTIDKSIDDHGGRFVSSAGDSVLAEFTSVVNAIECAVEIQRDLGPRNDELEDGERMDFRIGVNLGDIMVHGDDLFGDSVNIAARIQALAQPGQVCVSGTVFEHARNKTSFAFNEVGTFEVKNIVQPVVVFQVEDGAGPLERTARYVAQAGVGSAQWLAQAGVQSAETLAQAGVQSAQAVIGLSRRAIVIAIGVIAVITATLTVVGYEVYHFQFDQDGPLSKAKAAIAVLPFTDLSENEKHAAFADGISEDIITELSRFSDLLVFARNTTFQYRGQAVDVAEVGATLGARFVLEGSVRRSGNDLRVTAQLIDVESGGHVWAENYDVPADAVFDVQDQIAGKIVSTLGIKVKEADLQQAQRKPPHSLEAYDLVMQARQYTRDYSAASHARARDQLEQAVALEPDYARAHAWLAQTYLDEVSLDFNPRPDSLPRALDAAQRAVALDPNDAWAHYVLGKVYHRTGQNGLYEKQIEKALTLNPNDSEMLAELGGYWYVAGKFEQAMEMVSRAAAINPNHPNWFHFIYFFEHYRAGQFEEALTEAEKITMEDFYWTYVVRAAVQGQLGNVDAAREAVARLIELKPDFSESMHDEFAKWFTHEPLVEAMIDGLTKAGLGGDT